MRAYGSSSSLKQYSAVRLAPAARDWLASGAPSRPYQIFESVCNLLNTDGNVLSIMLAAMEMNPLGLTMDCPEPAPDFTELVLPDSEVHQYQGRLYVGKLSINLASAEIWDPCPNWDAFRENRQLTQNPIREIARLVVEDHAPESLAVFLSEPEALAGLIQTGWQERAREPIARLLDGLSAGEPSNIQAGAAALAGLGMGLTPSGDDFIIGVMYALWCTSPPEEATARCAELLQVAADKTNRLSASYLARAACGEAGEAWHTLIEAMAQGDAKALIDPVQSLIGLGHTSGQDALSGFVLGYRHVEPH